MVARTSLKASLFRRRELRQQSDQCLTANNITEGGDGPTLTIEAGTTVAFRYVG